MPTITKRKVASAATGYQRPSDWLALPAVVEGDEKIVALHAVYDTDANFCAILCRGAYTVDWGDGSAPENVADNVQANHLYSYASLGSGTLCTRGYRQAIVTITPQAGQHLTLANFGCKHTQAGLGDYGAQWLDIRMAGIYCTNVSCYINGVRCKMLEQFEFIGGNALTNTSYMFWECWSLQSVILFDTSHVTNMSYTFINCYSLPTVPLLDTSHVTTMAGMFYGCRSLYSVPLLDFSGGPDLSSMFYGCETLKVVPLFDTSLVANMSGMFTACIALETIPLFDTSHVTNMNRMFNGCSSLQWVPLLDTSIVTDIGVMFFGCFSLQSLPAVIVSGATDLSYFVYQCFSLQSAPLAGTKVSIDYSACRLSRAAIVAIFNGLASGVTGQTITVTGNWGAASLTAGDLLIAQNKGWTVAV